MTTTRVGKDQPRNGGIGEVVNSVRELARETRRLGESAAKVAERELAMAISISENMRDELLSRESLEAARQEEIPSLLRRDAHRAVDLAMDAGAVLLRTSVRLVEHFLDLPRPELGAAEVPGRVMAPQLHPR